MAALQKQWRILRTDGQIIDRLAAELEISPILARILIHRGLTETGRARAFLNPALSQLANPWDIPGLKEAAVRIKEAVAAGRKILVWGDYDVDGLTATAVLLLFLKKIGAQADPYIPHRHDEGYGLNQEAVRRAARDGYQTIITVDCGISNWAEIELAQQIGLEVIVTDHHNLPDRLPPALSVDPKSLPPEHPSYLLAGVGVAFKLVWALSQLCGQNGQELIAGYLDLVALGTVADLVPLLGENRVLVTYGLQVLALGKRPGLRALAAAAGLKVAPTVENIAFLLAPRLNAAGRLEHAELALQLLLTTDRVQAQELARRLNQLNQKRQAAGRAIKDSADLWLSRHDWRDEKILVLAGREWHPGVIGIVASQLADDCGRPVVLISQDGELARGSARSVAGVDIYQLLSGCREDLAKFGGHSQAAGFSLPRQSVPGFQKKLRELARDSISDVQLIPALDIEAEISLADVTPALWQEIKRLAPFGEGNPEPVFACRRAVVTELVPLSGGAHYRLRLAEGGLTLPGVAWRQKPPQVKIVGDRVDLALCLAEDDYERPAQLICQVQDLRTEPKDDQR